MLGAAELPIAILAWSCVVFLFIGLLGTALVFIFRGWEKVSFERERKRRDKIRKQALDNIVNLK